MNDTLKAIAHLIDDAVRQQELDADDLRALNEHMHGHLQEMKRQACAAVAMQIRAGSKVKIADDAPLSPKYILGTEAEVVRVKKTNAVIILGAVYGGKGRFYEGQEITCPLYALELVEAAG